MKAHNKITTGFVIQKYVELDDGRLVCLGQDFVAGEVDYEDLDGNPITPNTDKEEYQPFDMVKPTPNISIAEAAKFIQENSQ